MSFWPGVKFVETLNINTLCCLAGSRGWLVSGWAEGQAIVAIDATHFVRWRRLPPVLKLTLAETLERKTPTIRPSQLSVLQPFLERL